jgi:hypothetical protein
LARLLVNLVHSFRREVPGLTDGWHAARVMTAVNVQTANDSVQIGAPRTPFQASVRHSISTDGYDVTRHGWFLFVNSTMESTTPVVPVTNWDAELKK